MTDINETAKAILMVRPQGTVAMDFNGHHIQAMARLWLMKDEIIREMENNWDYDHSDPGGEYTLAPLLKKIREIGEMSESVNKS